MFYYFSITFVLLLFSTISVSGKFIEIAGATTTAGQYNTLANTIGEATRSSSLLSLDLIRAELPSINCTYYNATFKGLESCAVTGLQIDAEKLKFNLECSYIDYNSMHSMKGNVGDFTLEGHGPVRVLCDDYVLIFEARFEKNIGKNNKEHIQIKSFILEATPKGRVRLDFQNVNAGDKEKTAAFYEFVEQNWQLMDRELRAPVLQAFMDLFIGKLNHLLKNISAEELFTLTSNAIN